MSAPVIELQEVTSYYEQVLAVDRVSFSIRRGPAGNSAV